MRKHFPLRPAVALAAAVVAASSVPVWAQEAGARYAAAYRLTGFRLRASYVCPGDKKAMIDHAMVPISAPELMVFSKAYPETIKKWMGEGAGLFNDGVMQSGLNEECRRAQ